MGRMMDFAEYGPMTGHLLQLSNRRSLAFHVRDGMAWVADFRDGVGELMEATVWFRDRCGSIASAYPRRCLALEAAVPIPASMFEELESLHREVRGRHGLDEVIPDGVERLVTSVGRNSRMEYWRTSA
jgi:hypothetical protein